MTLTITLVRWRRYTQKPGPPKLTLWHWLGDDGRTRCNKPPGTDNRETITIVPADLDRRDCCERCLSRLVTAGILEQEVPRGFDLRR